MFLQNPSDQDKILRHELKFILSFYSNLPKKEDIQL